MTKGANMVTKALVQEAYESLKEKGVNPSLDALRIELGNRGSKTTIHRYVREIEDERASSRDLQGKVSDAVLELASRLAAQLKADADLKIEESENAFRETELKLTKALDERCVMLDRLSADVVALSAENEKMAASLEALATELVTIKQELAIAHQRSEDGERLIAEKDRAIASLEQKHQHNRQTMEHYRQSVKEQREQEQRRHEQLLQDQKIEVRNLQQSLSMKQHELTVSVRANAELSSAVTSLQQELSQAQWTIAEVSRQLTEQNVRATDNNKRLDIVGNENAKLLEKLEASEKARIALEKEAERTQQGLQRQLAELRGHLAAKNEIIEALYRIKDQT